MDYPSLHGFRLPLTEEERKAFRGVEGALMSMASISNQIRYGLQLFDFAETQAGLAGRESMKPYAIEAMRAYGAWQLIAARDGALRLVDLEELMAGANGYLKDCKPLFDSCNRDRLKKAFRLLETWFPNPNRRNIRNAAGHTAYVSKNEKKRAEHSATGRSYEAPGVYMGGLDQTAMTDNIFGRRYVASFNGQVAEFEVTEETATRVQTIVQTYFSGLPGLR
jgi:hypothetical protein